MDRRQNMAYAVGEHVLAFYSMHELKGSRYVKVSSVATHTPCFGQSEGWLPATVLRSDDADTYVRFTGPFREPGYGICESLDLYVPTSTHVRSTGKSAEHAKGTNCTTSTNGNGKNAKRTKPNPEEVAVSVFFVRWHDWWTDDRWSDYYIACEWPMKSLTQNGLQKYVPCDFETFTLFLKSSEDAVRFQESALTTMMKGRHRASLFYLWPTQKYHASDEKAFCEERAFFDLMQRVEAAGVPSRYPAPAHLYRMLCGKQMYTNMCLNKEFKVPVSVRVHASEVLRDPEEATKNSLVALNLLRKMLWNKDPSDGGVIKLGFSWMGKDVLPYRGEVELRKKLVEIFSKMQQIPTSCFVQEFVDKRIAELRVHSFCDGDRFRNEIRYMALNEGGTMQDGEVFDMTSAVSMSCAEALHQVWGGNEAAQKHAEKEARRLVDCWMSWYVTEWNARRCPANARFDFHVSWDKVAMPELWTCEVTECGASLCGLKIDARNVALTNCFFADRVCAEEDCICVQPIPLPNPQW